MRAHCQAVNIPYKTCRESGLGASGKAEIQFYQELVSLIDGIIRLLMEIKNNAVTRRGFY